MNSVSQKFQDDVLALLSAMPGPNKDACEAAISRDLQLTKPTGSLGQLEDIVLWLASWQAGQQPKIDEALVCVFAANHGVSQLGVSAYPAEVTRQMVANFRQDGAAINQLCKSFGLRLDVTELWLDQPTQDFTLQPAMTPEETSEAFLQGREAVPDGIDLLCLGEMGIGNTTAAAAIYAALYGGDAGFWVGRGTGLNDEGLARKRSTIEKGLALHKAWIAAPLGVLHCLGGREIAALAGSIVEARLKRVPVILDGYIVTAAAAILHALDPASIDHCLAGHVSPEGAHSDVLLRLGKKPLLDLGMRLGEGSGAAIAAGIVKAALACHLGMATFADAGVATKTA
jgi:nicotinate-nucleotide--dimethylbenzimidazole phosphoribosyltransferase